MGYGFKEIFRESVLGPFFISEIISANNDGDQGIHQWEWCDWTLSFI